MSELSWLLLVYSTSLPIAILVSRDLRRLNVEGWAIYGLGVLLAPPVGITAWALTRTKRTVLLREESVDGLQPRHPASPF